MTQKIGRNDPCHCGSGKKYKNCHMIKELPAKKKIKAKLLGDQKPTDLMGRTLGNMGQEPLPKKVSFPSRPEPEHEPLPPKEVEEIEKGPLDL